MSSAHILFLPCSGWLLPLDSWTEVEHVGFFFKARVWNRIGRVKCGRKWLLRMVHANPLFQLLCILSFLGKVGWGKNLVNVLFLKHAHTYFFWLVLVNKIMGFCLYTKWCAPQTATVKVILLFTQNACTLQAGTVKLIVVYAKCCTRDGLC